MKFKVLLDYAIDNHYNKTVDNAYNSVMKLLKSLYEKEVDTITYQTIEALKNELRKNGYSNATINSVLSMISVCYDTANTSEAKIFKNQKFNKPLIKKMNVHETKKATIPIEKDVRELYRKFALEHGMHDFYHYLIISYGTLLRVNEMLKISEKNIDYLNNEITIYKTKNKKTHTISMNNAVRKSIEAMRPKFFQDYTYRQIKYWFEKAEKYLNTLHYTPHSTRHAGASMLKRSGIVNSIIKEAGNWSSEAIIENYTHTVSKDVQKAFELLNDDI